MAVDNGPGAMPVFTKLTLRVTDINDNPPMIVVNALTGSSIAEVREHLDPPGTFVAHVAVTDADTGQNGQTECQLHDSQDDFRLEPLIDSGEYKITTTTTFDREEREQYSIILVCHDNGSPSRSTSATIVVTVSDINDHSPELPSNLIHLSLVENNPPRTVLTTVNATDRDTGINAQLRYSLKPEFNTTDRYAGVKTQHRYSLRPEVNPRKREVNAQLRYGLKPEVGDGNDGALTIDPVTGVVATNRTFDYEEGRNDFRFVVTVSDGGDPVRSTTATLHLTITDINDNQPRFDRRVYHVTVPEDVPVGTSVGRVNATDDDVTPRFGHVTYALSLLSDSFKVCPAMESGFDFNEIYICITGLWMMTQSWFCCALSRIV